MMASIDSIQWSIDCCTMAFSLAPHCISHSSLWISDCQKCISVHACRYRRTKKQYSSLSSNCMCGLGMVPGVYLAGTVSVVGFPYVA